MQKDIKKYLELQICLLGSSYAIDRRSLAKTIQTKGSDFNLPEVCSEATHLYLKWHDEMMRASQYSVDPLWMVLKEGGPFHSRGRLKEYCMYLQETKRAWTIPELKKRHPEEFR